MVNRWLSVAVVALALLLLSRGVAGPLPVQAQTSAMLRVVQVAVSVPAVDISLNGQPLFSNLAFKAVSDYQPVQASRQAVRATVSGQPQQILFDASVDLQAGQPMTLALTGTAPTITPVLLHDGGELPPAGQARVRIVHAVAGAPAMDVSTSTGQPLLKNVAYDATGAFVDVAAGTYTLNAQFQDQTAPALSIPDVTVSAGQVVTLFVLPAQGTSTGLSVLSVAYSASSASTLPTTMPATGTGGGATHGTPFASWLVMAALLALAAGSAMIWRTRRP